jgi:hypothetical protein
VKIDKMMCICGHTVAAHMNSLQCCLACGCTHCVPDLQWDVAYEIGYDEDDHEDIGTDDSRKRSASQ